MFDEKAKKSFEELGMEYPAVCVKYHAVKPENVPAYDGEKVAFCQYLKHAQMNRGTFYITESDDACYGKLESRNGAVSPPVTASGQAGVRL